MKQMILILGLVGVTCFNLKAQTNTTFNTDMQTSRIYEEERRGGRLSSGIVKLNTGSDNQELKAGESLNMNSVQKFEGYRSSWNSNTVQRYFGTPVLNPSEILNNFNQYDTSKNNGHCLGCGSGSSTDHRPWRRNGF